MRRTKITIGLCLAAVATIVAIGPAAAVEDLAAPQAPGAEPEESGWQFEVLPYVWLPATRATVAVGDQSATVDVSIGDLLDLVGSLEAGGAMAHVEAQNDDLSLFVDFIFMGVNTTQATGPGGVDTRVKLLEYFVEWGATYRLFEYPTTIGPPIWVDALAGARWTRISTEIGREARPRDAKSLVEFVDPVVGGRFHVPFYGSPAVGTLGIAFRGDAAGFGAGSDLSWNLLSAVNWETPWELFSSKVAIRAGYKAYYTDYTQEDDDTTTSMTMQTGGPILGVGFRF